MKYKMKKPLGPGCVFSVMDNDLRKKEIAAIIDAIVIQKFMQSDVCIEESFFNLIRDVENGYPWRYYTFGVYKSESMKRVFAFYSDPVWGLYGRDPEDFGAEKWAEVNEWFCKISLPR